MTVYVELLKLKADAGTKLEDAIRGAVMLALKENRQVELEFSGDEYLIHPTAIIAHVKFDNKKEKP
jgi:hypothetical protein